MNLLTIWWLIIIILMCCQPWFAPWTIRPMDVLYRLLQCMASPFISGSQTWCVQKRQYCNILGLVGKPEYCNVIILFRKTKFCEETVTNFTPFPEMGVETPNSQCPKLVRNRVIHMVVMIVWSSELRSWILDYRVVCNVNIFKLLLRFLVVTNKSNKLFKGKIILFYIEMIFIACFNAKLA